MVHGHVPRKWQGWDSNPRLSDLPAQQHEWRQHRDPENNPGDSSLYCTRHCTWRSIHPACILAPSRKVTALRSPDLHMIREGE